MPIQALNSQTLFACKPILKETRAKADGFDYRDLLKSQGLCPKKQIDQFLRFAKNSSSQKISAVLDVIEGKRVHETKADSQLDCSVEATPIRQILDLDGRVVQLVSSDGSLDYKIAYAGNITTITNQITGEVHQQETDDQGRLIREVLPCGLEIVLNFDGDYLSEVILPDQSRVSYQYIDQSKVVIQRVGLDKQVQYKHIYNLVDGLLEETPIGGVKASQGSLERAVSNAEYPVGELLSSEARLLDDQKRVISYNGYNCSYDEEGRLIKKSSSDQTMKCSYDALDRLSSVEVDGEKIEYTYDLGGRRLSKTLTVDGKTTKEFYLYQGVNQIGVYNEAKEPIYHRVIGAQPHTHLPLAVAIESQGKVYAPIYNSSYNISQLIDKDTQEVIHYEKLSPFGDNLGQLNPVCPWIFATKHYDVDTGLIDFSNRQYDPSIKQWTSRDSDSRTPEDELYSYCNNNPLKYIDPDGKFRINFGWAIPIGVGAARGARSGAAGGIWGIIAGVVVGAALGLAVDSAQKKINEDDFKRRKKNKPRLDNDVKNPQYTDAVQEIERKLGEKLTQKQKDELHGHITGQGYGYHEMVDEGFHLFDKRYRNN